MSGGDLGADGYPDKPAQTWEKPISCRIIQNRKNNLGKQDENTFVIVQYEVLIDPVVFDAERVKLICNGRDLGEFSVLWTEYLDAVGALKIVV